MAAYDITLHGCDDSTTVTADLDDAEFAAFQRVAAQTQASSQFSCMPKMTIVRQGEPIPYE